MISFGVSDMTCGHCVSTITQALKVADPDARVEIDLGRHLVRVEPGGLGDNELSEAIQRAGYTPRSAGAGTAPAVAPGTGGCCGCR